MSYDSSEISVKSGQPVELHKWQVRGSSTMWCYTSAGYDITYLEEVFVSVPGLTRSEIDENQDPLKAELTVTLPRTNKMMKEHALAAVEGIIDYTLYRAHGTDYIPYWVGVVKGVLPIKDEDYAVITMGVPTDELNVPAGYYRYSRFCRAPLYGIECGVDDTDFKVSGSIASISGLNIVSASFGTVSDGALKGGWVEINGYSRKIDTHSGTTIHIVGAIPGMVAGMACVSYYGCDHSMQMCDEVFDNILNYRGFAWIPNDNPFTGVVI